MEVYRAESPEKLLCLSALLCVCAGSQLWHPEVLFATCELLVAAYGV